MAYSLLTSLLECRSLGPRCVMALSSTGSHDGLCRRRASEYHQ